MVDDTTVDDFDKYVTPAAPQPTGKVRPTVDYRQLYNDVGQKYGVDPDLLYNQAKHESINFNPNFVYGPGRSPKGAAGIAQFMPDTARQYGLRVQKGQDDRFNPQKAADAHARLMKDLIDKYGDPSLALAAYNSGTNKTPEQAARAMQRIPETRDYVQKLAPQDDFDKYVSSGPQQPTTPVTPQQAAPVDDDFEKYVTPETPQEPASVPSTVPGMSALRQIASPSTRGAAIQRARQPTQQPAPKSAVGMIPGMSALRQTQAAPTTGLVPGVGMLRQARTQRRQDTPEITRAGLRGLSQMAGAPTQLLPQGAQDWINEAAAQGTAQLMSTGAGVARQLPTDPLDMISGQRPAADALQKGAEQVSSDVGAAQAQRGTLSRGTQNLIAGGIGSAPAMILTSLGVPAAAAFGLQSELEASGRDADFKDIVKETAKGATIGALFDLPLPVKAELLTTIQRAAVRAGIVGGGTAAITGSPQEAVINAAFAATGAGKETEPQVGEPVSHPNPDIDGRPIVAKAADGRVIVQNETNATGISRVKHQPVPAEAGVAEATKAPATPPPAQAEPIPPPEAATSPAEQPPNVAAQPAPEGVSTTAPVPEVVKPWEMTRDQIEEEFQRKKAEDDNLEASILGPELAKKYARLQRSANSSYDIDKTNRASDEIEKIEASLSERDRNRLYGIGEEGPQLDELRDYRQSLGNLDDRDPQSLAESMKWAVSRVGNETDPAKMNHQQRVAYGTLREAARIAYENGWDTQAISEAAVKAAGARFADPEDARIMLSRFLKNEPAPTAPERKQLTAPQAETTAPVPAAGVGEGKPERVFYRGTVPGETTRINEPFEAAKGRTFVAKTEKGARNYGESIERITAKPNAKILDMADADFWKLTGRRRPPNGYIGSALRRGETLVDAVNDTIRKAEARGYDAVSFGDADIGTVILNEKAFNRNAAEYPQPETKATAPEEAPGEQSAQVAPPNPNFEQFRPIDAEMNDTGRGQIETTRNKLKVGRGDVVVDRVNTPRLHESAEIFAAKGAKLQPSNHPSDWMRGIGGERVTDERIADIADAVKNTPDRPITPGTDSFNQFSDKQKAFWGDVTENADPNRKTIVPAHYNEIKWLEAGGLKGEVDPNEFLRKDGEPGDSYKLDRNGIPKKATKNQGPGIYPVRHGETEYNRADSQAEPTTAAGESKDTTGIAHRVSEARGIAAERGVGTSPEKSIEQGRAIYTPERANAAIEQFEADPKKAVSEEMFQQARAHEEALAKVTNAAADKFGLNSPEYKAANEAEKAWIKRIKPLQTEWSKHGVAQQGETAIDTGTFHGIVRAFKDSHDREMTPSEEVIAKRLSSAVATHETNLEGAQRELISQLDKAHGIKDLPDDVQNAVKRFVKEAQYEARTQARKQTRKALDEEAAVIKQNIAAAFKKVKGQTGVQPLGLARFDPEGEITKEILKYAKNRVKAGLTDQAQLIDDVHKVLSDFTDVTRREVSEVLGGFGGLKRERKTSEWMTVKGEIRKGLKAEDEVQRITDLGNRVAAGGRIDPKDAKAVWQYTREKYIDKGVSAPDAFQEVARDFGTSAEQVRRAIANQPKAQRMTDEMYQRASMARQARVSAESWVRARDMPPWMKAIKDYNETMFNLAIAGHGTVAPGTHAASNIFHPTRWANYIKNVGRTWKSAYSPASHEKMIQDMVADPLHPMWLREGLAVDPGRNYDQYQSQGIAKMFGALGRAGNRGFDALKMMRQDFANARWNKLRPEQQTPEMAQEIARMVNHATGAPHKSDYLKKVVDITPRNLLFAAPLEESRWMRILGDPARAVDVYGRAALSKLGQGKAPSASERYFAKETVKDVAGFTATYLSALALNQAMLRASSSKDKVNFTDPSKTDWLRFKVAGRSLELTGGIISTIGFLGRLAYASQYPAQGETPFKTMGKEAMQYGRGKLAPGAGMLTDVVTRTDYSGRPMPFSSNEGTEARPRLSWAEYAGQRGPIPMSEGVRDFYDQMRKQGVPMSTIRDFTSAVLKHPGVAGQSGGIGLFSGVTGLRVGPEYTPNPDSRAAKQARNAQLVQDYRSGKITKDDLDEKLSADELTKSDVQSITKQGGMTPRQAAFSNARPMDALDRYTRMSDAQKAEVQDIMERHAWTLTHSDSLTEAQKEKYQERLDNLGIEPAPPKKKSGSPLSQLRLSTPRNRFLDRFMASSQSA